MTAAAKELRNALTSSRREIPEEVILSVVAPNERFSYSSNTPKFSSTQ